MTIPAELLAIAQATRTTFGPGVKLRHVASPEGVMGDAKLDAELADMEAHMAAHWASRGV